MSLRACGVIKKEGKESANKSIERVQAQGEKEGREEDGGKDSWLFLQLINLHKRINVID